MMVADVLNNKVGELNNPDLGSTVVDIQMLNNSNADCMSKTSQRLVLINRVDGICMFEIEAICCICE
jgi:hypothetical protein